MKAIKLSAPLGKKELLKLLPHKGKMHLLDRVTFFDFNNRSISSEVDIKKDNIFYDEKLGGIPSYVSFEYIAQTISALSGIEGAVKGTPVKPGVILSVNGYKSSVPFFKADTTVQMSLTETCTLDRVFTYDGIVLVDGKQVVSAQITVMEIDDMMVLEKQS